MRYRLRTLVMATAVAPPAIGFLYFHWWPLLLLTLCIAAIALWVMGGLAFCRFVANVIFSVMD
jgi:hypothetical protein